MSYENIQYASENGIARITLSRPDRLNSFTMAMHRELRDALDRVSADESVRVLLLTGAGRACWAPRAPWVWQCWGTNSVPKKQRNGD